MDLEGALIAATWAGTLQWETVDTTDEDGITTRYTATLGDSRVTWLTMGTLGQQLTVALRVESGSASLIRSTNPKRIPGERAELGGLLGTFLALEQALGALDPVSTVQREIATALGAR